MLQKHTVRGAGVTFFDLDLADLDLGGGYVKVGFGDVGVGVAFRNNGREGLGLGLAVLDLGVPDTDLGTHWQNAPNP